MFLYGVWGCGRQVMHQFCKLAYEVAVTFISTIYEPKMMKVLCVSRKENQQVRYYLGFLSGTISILSIFRALVVTGQLSTLIRWETWFKSKMPYSLDLIVFILIMIWNIVVIFVRKLLEIKELQVHILVFVIKILIDELKGHLNIMRLKKIRFNSFSDNYLWWRIRKARK